MESIAKEIGFILTIIIALLAIGTYAYQKLEGWSAVDAFYFSTVTLTTVGFGDLHPTTDESKLFTSAFTLVGVGAVFSGITLIFSRLIKRNYGISLFKALGITRQKKTYKQTSLHVPKKQK